jgi:arylsulfatase A-like enzyme
MTSQAAHLSHKRNLIVFLTDQQRADTMACYGNAKVHAPNLNKLASESIVFNRAYVTQPVCSPSRSSLMTGLWPHTTGCTSNGSTLDPRFRVLPELLQDRDYRTAYMGKWHLGLEGAQQRGFEKWISTQHASDYSQFLISKGLIPDREEGGFSALTVSYLPLELSQPKFLEKHACDFIEKQRHNPFILVVAFVEPHSPYNGPLNNEHSLKEVAVDPTASIPLKDDVPLRYRLKREWQQEQALVDSTGKRGRFYFGATEDDYQRINQNYLGLVTLVDQSIGGILDFLERAGLSDETVVVHTSDHGDTLGAHQLFGKETMYEEAVRVPYMIRIPGERSGQRIPQAVSHIDFLPTLFDLLGQPKPAQCAGKSLLPLMRGEAMPADSVFMEWSPNKYATSVGRKIKEGTTLAPLRMINQAVEESTRTVIMPDGWKLSLRDKDLNELYNLKDDPRETHNLYYSGQCAAIISRCADEILRWQESMRDKLKLSYK